MKNIILISVLFVACGSQSEIDAMNMGGESGSEQGGSEQGGSDQGGETQISNGGDTVPLPSGGSGGTVIGGAAGKGTSGGSGGVMSATGGSLGSGGVVGGSGGSVVMSGGSGGSGGTVSASGGSPVSMGGSSGMGGMGGMGDVYTGPCVHPRVVKNCHKERVFQHDNITQYLEYCYVPPGCFSMGDVPERSMSDAYDLKARNVYITKGFWFPKEYKVDGWLPGLEVTNYTWDAAINICNLQSEENELQKCYTCSNGITGRNCKPTVTKMSDCKGYRLPTEAEWEYTFKGGTKTQFWNGTNLPQAGSSDSVIRAALATYKTYDKLENPWGIVGMMGKAGFGYLGEFTNDFFSDSWYSDTNVDPQGPPRVDVKFDGTSYEGRHVQKGQADYEPILVYKAASRSLPPVGIGATRCIRNE